MASNDEVRAANIKLRQSAAAFDALDDKTYKNSLLSKINEIASLMSVNGETATDLTLTPAAGATVSQLQTAGSGASGTSTKKFKVPGDSIDELCLIKLAGSGDATPSVTITIQGSTTAAFSSPATLYSADSSAPATFTATGTVITDAGAWTKVRLIRPRQQYSYIRVTWSANTNVTALAFDLWYLAGAGVFS